MRKTLLTQEMTIPHLFSWALSVIKQKRWCSPENSALIYSQLQKKLHTWPVSD